MGVTIHYRGKLNSTDLIDPFCEELKNISIEMEWDYSCFDFNKNTDKIPLKGLFIKPHKSAETLQFMVDQLGNLRNAFLVKHVPDDSASTFFIHVKTQFAPIEIHIAVIKLLKYLQQKYALNLEVWDEGHYGETGNSKILIEKFRFLNEAMDQLEDVLNSIEIEVESTATSVADKIEEILKNMKFRKR